jgi:hypothetical protein
MTKICETNLPFATKKSFFDHIESLPSATKWSCTPMHVVGNIKKGDNFETETLELWHQDPVKVVERLLGNLNFKDVGVGSFRQSLVSR